MKVEKALKEVKDELVGEQNMLWQAFRLETFVRKHKISLIIIAVIIVILVVYFVTSYAINSNREQKSSDLFAEIIEHPNASLASQLEKLNPKLYDFYLYNKVAKENPVAITDNADLAKLSKSSNDGFLSDRAKYEVANFNQDLKGLEAYAKSTNDLNFANLAYLQIGFIYFQNGNIKKGQEALANVKLEAANGARADSRIYQVAQLLRHYGVTQMPDTNTQATTPKGSNIDETKLIESELTHANKNSASSSNQDLKKETSK
ncbi:hypothetical protein BKH43_01245 [Helicobacter sp. 13S00401-1]|uniref:hypothetical protein n=1 Tax=Helicobacter sp. 13S00401-1 TaxID=1905758 RepID=UPI000BA563D4|nr:hypothetical protein [Helicobacter sp. 13S00401-1]PAF51886.1 hypothetical protein BKH43_01245 [Helicobacter sp. 13S00401-1]